MVKKTYSEKKYSLGIDLGGTTIKLGIVDDSGKLYKKMSLPSKSNEGPKIVIKQIGKGITKILQDSKKDICGIGIGSPGCIILKKGTVENPPNLPGWGKIQLGKILQKKFGYDVYVENDANVAAIGELFFGSGRKLNNFLMVTLGTGVGGGIIINRKIYRGENGSAGEIGHLSISSSGRKCKCGSRGCIESYVGNANIIELAKNKLRKDKKSKLWKVINSDLKNLTPQLISEAANLDDKLSKTIIIEIGQKIGMALSSVVNVLDIPSIIIGGGVSGFGKLLIDSIQDELKSRVLIPLQPIVKVKMAKLKNEAGIKGAGALVFYKL